jgi:hypothetical protein
MSLMTIEEKERKLTFMSNLKTVLNPRYEKIVGDSLRANPDSQDYNEIITELNGYFEFIEKWLGKEITPVDSVFYITQLVSAFNYKSNKLTALGIYYKFINDEAEKIGLTNEDLFYIRKMDHEEKYSPQISGAIRSILIHIESRSHQLNHEITSYFKLAYMYREYLLIQDEKLKRALLYEMYDLQFNWVKMLSLYSPIKGRSTGVELQAFDVSDDIHRGWLKKLRIE